MLVSIVMVVHNRIEVTKEGLKCLLDALHTQLYEAKHKQIKYEVVIVDDGSTDGTSEYIKKNYPQVKILFGSGNLWWTGGINKALRYSKEELNADYYLIWNNDVCPGIRYFENLLELIKKYNEDVLIGPYIYEFNSAKLWSSGGRFNRFTGKKSMIKEKINKKNNKVYDWLTGMGTLIPKKIIDQFGYLDEDTFPQYHSDIDYTLRVNYAGVKVIVSEDLKIYNKTEYSSYKGFDLKSFFFSVNSRNIGSRYNISKDVMFHKMHCISYLWIFQLIKKYIKYGFEVMVK